MSSSESDDEYSTNGGGDGGGRSRPSRRAASLGQNKLKSSLKNEQMDDVAWSWAIERDDEAVAASRKRKSKDDDVSRKKRKSKGKSNERFGVDLDLVDSDEEPSEDNSRRGRMIVGRDPESDSGIQSGYEESDDDDDDDDDDMPSVERISRAKRGNNSSLRAALKNDVDDGDDESSVHPKTIISRIVSLQSPGGRKMNELGLSTPDGTTASQLLEKAEKEMAAIRDITKTTESACKRDTPQPKKFHVKRDPSSRNGWKVLNGAAPSPYSKEVQKVLEEREILTEKIAYAKNKAERQVLERQSYNVNKKLERLCPGGKWERASTKRKKKYGKSAQVVYTPPRDARYEMVVEEHSNQTSGYRTHVICESEGAPTIEHGIAAVIEQGWELSEYVTFIEADQELLDLKEIELDERQSVFFFDGPGGYILLTSMQERRSNDPKRPGYPRGTVSCRSNIMRKGKTDPQISIGKGNGEARRSFGLHIFIEYHFGKVGNRPMPAGRTITIDHINGDKQDCRPVNLRRANGRQQGNNRGAFTAVASDEDYFSSDDEYESDVDSDSDSD